MAMVWLDGALLPQDAAHLSITDRGFTLADGVFETVRTAGEHPLWLDDHLARLAQGAATLAIPLPYSRQDMVRAVATLLQSENHPQGALRITLTRGPTDLRGLWNPAEQARPTLLITAAQGAPATPQRLVVALGTRRNEHSPLSRIKSLHYGDNILARREALQRGATDAVMLNTQGRVACSTVGNLFLHVDGRWLTPVEHEGMLPGLARKRLLTLLDASECVVPMALLAQASAALVCNSLGCSVVTHLEGRALVSDAVDAANLEAIYRNDAPGG